MNIKDIKSRHKLLQIFQNDVVAKLGVERSFLLFSLVIYLCACIPPSTATPLLTSTHTPIPATSTPTTEWFPPTITYTPFPSPIPSSPTPDQRPGIGKVIFQDDFSGSSSDWTLHVSQNGSVAFGKQELTIAISEGKTFLFSVLENVIIRNFYLEITASPSLCHDKDEYGVLIRVTPNIDYYRYSLSCDGHLRLDRVYGNQASSPQPWVISGAVPPGAPSRSRLGVWVVDEEMRFFVNDEYQFSIQDPLIPSGMIGVFARATSDMAVTVNFSELIIYEIVSAGN